MNEKLFRPGDLLVTFVWLCGKIFYTLAPMPVLFLWANLKGRCMSRTTSQGLRARDNLFKIFGDAKSEKEVRAIVRRYFEFETKLETLLRALPLKGLGILSRCPVEGLHYLDAALAQGKGVILVSAHFGYARLVEYILQMKNYKIRVVRSRSEMMNHAEKRQKRLSEGFSAFASFMYKRLKTPELVAQEQELFAGINVRPLVKALQQNDILYVLGDGTRAIKFVTLDFFGFQLPFPTGYLNVALATGATVLPAFAVDATDRHGVKLVIEKPLALVKEEPASPNSNVESFARVFEDYVRRYPHLYKMFNNEKKIERRLARSRGEVAERYIPGRRRSNEKLSESEK